MTCVARSCGRRNHSLVESLANQSAHFDLLNTKAVVQSFHEDEAGRGGEIIENRGSIIIAPFYSPPDPDSIIAAHIVILTTEDALQENVHESPKKIQTSTSKRLPLPKGILKPAFIRKTRLHAALVFFHQNTFCQNVINNYRRMVEYFTISRHVRLYRQRSAPALKSFYRLLLITVPQRYDI